MSKSPYWEWGHTSNMVISFSHIFTKVDKTVPFAPSPIHQHFYRWYVETIHSHGWFIVILPYFTIFYHILPTLYHQHVMMISDLITNHFSQPVPACKAFMSRWSWSSWPNMLDSKAQGSPTRKNQHIQRIRYTRYQRTNENTGYTQWFWL